MAIAAVVVSHNDPALVAATLAAVDSQTQKPDLFIAIGDFVEGSLPDHWEIIRDVNLGKRAKSFQSAIISAAIDALPYGFAQDDTSWLWLLTQDVIPQPEALAELTTIIEAAPSAAIVAPKLVLADSPRVIAQMGLTLTRSWRLFSSVSDEFDQSQHDQVEDVLAVPTTGALLNATRYLAILGLRQKLSPLAADYDLAMRLRLAGHRVLVAPLAKVAVAASANSILLSTRTQSQLRKAQIELLSAYLPALGALLLGLLAPLIAVIQAIWLLVVKSPQNIWPTLGSGIWWFFSLPAQLAHRSGMSRAQRAGKGKLANLFASREDINRANRSKVETVADAATSTEETAASLTGSGGLWFMALLAVLSFKFWPADIAVTGGGLLPLSGSLSAVFSHAGSSWQTQGLGLAAPSDPFSWVLLVLAAFTAWAPSLSITLFIFLAKSLAWATAWQALKLVTQRRSAIYIGATLYVFWPAFSAAQLNGQFGSLVALVLLPAFVYGLAKVLRLGSNTNQTWTWVGVSSLLAAIISAAAPSLTPLLALVILLLAIYRFKRIGYLVWLPVPLLVLWIPSAIYLGVGVAHPLALLADPGVPVALDPQSTWQALLGGSSALAHHAWAQFGVAQYAAAAVALLLASLAVFGRRSGTAFWLIVAMLTAVASGWAIQSLSFQSTGSNWVGGSPTALLGLAGLLVAFLVTMLLGARTGFWPNFAGILGWLASATLAAVFILAPSALNYTDGQLVPALVQAQAQQHPQTRILVLEQDVTGKSFDGTLITGPGLHLNELSNAYRYSLAKLVATDARYQQLSQLVADLVSANGANLGPTLARFNIDYVLVTQSDASDVSSSLDTVKELESVGVTPNGRLWRVKNAQLVPLVQSSPWSLTRSVQISVLALFGLLALPTRRKARPVASNTDQDLNADSEVVN